MDLRRAYGTLGISESATLEEARAAYATWSALLADLVVSADGLPATPAANPAPDGGGGEHALLARHELDLAWYTIEQAHIEGALFVRRARGCTECGRIPAVRVSLKLVEGHGLRTRRSTEHALVCRDCGIAACADIQRANLRQGWWSLLGPLHMGEAMIHNAGERRFLRRVDDPRRRIAPGPRLGAEPPVMAERSFGGRVLAWTLAIIGVAMIVGLTVPATAGNPPGTIDNRPHQSTERGAASDGDAATGERSSP